MVKKGQKKSSKRKGNVKPAGRPLLKKRPAWPVFLMAGIVLIGFIGGVVLVPALAPGAAGQTADVLRSIIGPQAVAQLESLSFQLQDGINQYRYKVSGGRPQISWQSSPQSVGSKSGDASIAAGPSDGGGMSTLPAIDTGVTSAPDSSSALDWQPYGQVVNGRTVLGRALVAADPTRSYAGVALVRMDLSRLRLNMMPGTKDPVPLSDIGQPIPNQGMVPPSDWNNLVAAFNGGFKAIHGHYGMMVDNETLIEPINGIATVAIYRNGDVRIGVWGTDILPSPDIIAYRQNCPPLIEDGQITNYVDNPSRQLWGLTQTADATWRTGLGITRDGRYLIYAVGNGTTAGSLAEALQAGGAYWAMQLDINSGYEHFVTYQTANSDAGSVSVVQPLLSQMTEDPSLYLQPYPRDFFYLTMRQ